jgi:hypothetical protein
MRVIVGADRPGGRFHAQGRCHTAWRRGVLEQRTRHPCQEAAVHARLLLAVALLLPACGLPTGSDDGAAFRLDAGSNVVFRAERGEYRHGETARLTLRNRTGRSIGYNLCASAREIREGDGWTRVAPLRLCADAYFELAPGAETAHEEAITAEWRPGTYRMVTTVIVVGSGRRGEVLTGRFAVRP